MIGQFGVFIKRLERKMSKNRLKELANRKHELIRTIHAYIEKKRYLIKTIEELNKQNHSGLISHERYKFNLNAVLRDKSLDQWIKYYNSHIENYRRELKICERGLEKEGSRAEIRSKAIPLLIVIGILIALGFGLRYIEPTITGATVAEIGVTIDGATSFKAEENPSFEIKIDKGNLITGFAIGASRDEFNASLITPSGKEIKLKDEIKKTAKGFNIELENDRSFAPGLYKLRIKTINSIKEQDFTWGVLAINVDKSIYLENEEAFIGIAVLDDLGRIVCNADVTLEIIDPNNNVDVLSTENGKIKISSECNVLGVTNLPDYYTDYKVGEKGIYLMNLTAKTRNGIRNIIDGFVVQERIEFDVERKGPTRIYPYVPYLMNFTIKANEDYSGKIIEFVPNSFRITEQKDLEIIENGYLKALIWDKELVKGKTYSLFYEFDALDISPEFYLLGYLEIGKFKEIRHWQIASDAINKDLNVTACSGGTSCSVAEYNTNDTGTGHTIAKGATGIIDSWSNLNGPNIGVEDVIFHFRHAGETGISGVWTTTFRNEAATFTYCSDNSIGHSATDTYIVINLTGGSCKMNNKTRVHDLEIAFLNGDSGGGQNAFIYYADLFVKYTPLNATLDIALNTPDPITINSGTIFSLNTTIKCSGNTGATCENITAFARFNNSASATPNININTTVKDSPFYILKADIIGEVKNESDGFSISAAGSLSSTGITFDSRDNSFWITDGFDAFVYHFNSSGQNQSDGFSISAAGAASSTGITFDSRNNSFWITDGFDDFVYHFNSSGQNQSDGFSISAAGSSSSTGITFDSRDNSFWITDANKDFVYHITGRHKNPQKVVDLEVGESVQLNWTINATATAGSYEVGVFVNSTVVSVTENSTITNATVIINISVANTAPSIPLLNQPFNNTNTSDNTPMFEWFNSTDAENNPINYTLEIWNNSLMTSIAYRNISINEQGKNQTNLTLPSTLLDGTYYWRVNASDVNLSSSWSLNRTLNIDTTPPKIFIIQPTNTTYTVTNLSLNFTIKDDFNNLTWYNLNNGVNTTINGNTTFIANSGSNNTIFLYHRDMAMNINASNVSFTVSLAAGDANFRPNITFISLNSSETIIAGDKRVLNFSFIANDTNGAIGLDNNSIIANITFAGDNTEAVRNATCSVSTSQVGLAATERNYTCGFSDIYFYDAAGSWQFFISISDNNSNDNYTINSSQWFSIQQTISINRTIATVNFPAVSLGENNVTSSNDPNQMQNIGNKNNIVINLTAINLIVDSDSSTSSIRIDAINFTTNYITNAAKVECHYNATAGAGAGARLLNNTMIPMNITIRKGADQLNSTYYCLLHTPGNLLSQTYSTGGTPNEPDWTFTAG